jgi:hypothetical protein
MSSKSSQGVTRVAFPAMKEGLGGICSFLLGSEQYLGLETDEPAFSFSFESEVFH